MLVKFEEFGPKQIRKKKLLVFGTSGLKTHTKCGYYGIVIESGWRIIWRHSRLIESIGMCVLSLAHGSELRGSDVCQKVSGLFPFNLARVRFLL